MAEAGVVVLLLLDVRRPLRVMEQKGRWLPLERLVWVLLLADSPHFHRRQQRDRLPAVAEAVAGAEEVEASSSDRVWGIGFNAKQAMSNRESWGENRLGKALMEVRTQLRKEEEAV